MKTAWILEGIIRDIAPDNNPGNWYNADIACHYDTLVPDEAVNGQGWDGSNLLPIPSPATPSPTPPPVRKWSSADVRKGLTFAEKSKWDNNSTPEIVTAKIEFEQSLEHNEAKEVLDFLVEAGSISQASENKVLCL